MDNVAVDSPRANAANIEPDTMQSDNSIVPTKSSQTSNKNMTAALPSSGRNGAQTTSLTNTNTAMPSILVQTTSMVNEPNESRLAADVSAHTTAAMPSSLQNLFPSKSLPHVEALVADDPYDPEKYFSDDPKPTKTRQKKANTKRSQPTTKSGTRKPLQTTTRCNATLPAAEARKPLCENVKRAEPIRDHRMVEHPTDGKENLEIPPNPTRPKLPDNYLVSFSYRRRRSINEGAVTKEVFLKFHDESVAKRAKPTRKPQTKKTTTEKVLTTKTDVVRLRNSGRATTGRGMCRVDVNDDLDFDDTTEEILPVSKRMVVRRSLADATAATANDRVTKTNPVSMELDVADDGAF